MHVNFGKWTRLPLSTGMLILLQTPESKSVNCNYEENRANIVMNDQEFAN